MLSLRHAAQSFLSKQGILIDRVRDPLIDQASLLRKPPALVFDVGANEGQTVAAYRQRFPDTEIYSFEPTPAIFDRLSARFTGMTNVHPVKLALGERDGEIEFYEYNLTGYNSTRQCTLPGVHVTKASKVPVTTLDGFCRERAIRHIDVLKMDIQGAELAALKGAQNLLGDRRVSLIYAEVLFRQQYEGQAYYHEIAEYLLKFGYRLFRFYDMRFASDRSFDYADALFCAESIFQDGALSGLR